MFSMIMRLARRTATTGKTRTTRLDPDTMSLRDWADLPAHHPVRDRAPC